MNAIAVPEIATPRPIKVIILAAVLLGELFVAGYFWNAQDRIEISDNTSEFISKAMLFSVVSSLLMVPLKMITSIFLVAKPLVPSATLQDIEANERRRRPFRIIGYILIGAWIGACSWGIVMFILNFNEIALNKWMLTYLGTFLSEVIIIFQVKLLLKILFGFLLMKIMRTHFMRTFAGVIVGKIIDFLMMYL